MDSDDYQDINHKISQGIWATIIQLQVYTEIRTPEQQNISCVKWKLRGNSGRPNRESP